MFCIACGAKAQENSTFCAKCGARLPGRPARPEPRLAVPDSSVSSRQAEKGSKTTLITVIAISIGGVILLGLIAVLLIPKMRSPGNQERFRFVLQVVTDESINMETDLETDRLRDLLKKDTITYQKVIKEGLGRIAVQGTMADQEGKTRSLLDEYARDWNYNFTGGRANLSLKPLVIQFLRDQAVSQAKATIDNRINLFGIRKPLIQRQGADKIVVELPGVENPERAKELIKVTAVMEWKLVKAGPAAADATLLQATNGVVPDDAEILRGDPKRGQGGVYLVNKVAVVTGRDLRTIRRTQDEWNNPAVAFTLNDEGGARFEQVTGANIGKQIALILDKKIQSAPVIEGRILRSQGGIIRGRFTPEEADDLVVVLKAGSLPCTIIILEEEIVH